MHSAIAEAVKRAGAYRLVQIAMDRRGVETVLFQGLCHHIHIHLAVAEDDGIGAGFALALDQRPQNRALFGKAAVAARRGELDQLLFDRGRGGGLTRHFDLDRVVQESIGDPLDLGCHGGRIEQGLAGLGSHLEDALDVRDKAHVEHAVGLVHHHDLHAGQQQFAAFEMVEQAARGGDQHIDATVDQLVLFAEGNSADQQRLGQLGVLGVGFKVFGDLGGQFAGRGQHQAARHPGAGAALAQKGDHRQHEAGGLAGAGLGDAQHILTQQGGRDRLRLYGGRGFVAGIGDGLQHAGIQREVGKFGHVRPERAGSARQGSRDATF